MAIDILANNAIFESLKRSGVVATASSEETPTEDPMGGEGYSVAFDPLDGSSVIDTNFAVGVCAYCLYFYLCITTTSYTDYIWNLAWIQIDRSERARSQGCWNCRVRTKDNYDSCS